MTEQSINLIPQVSQEEVKSIEKKVTVNLTGVVFIFLVVLFSLIILGFNLWARLDRNTVQQKLKSVESEIQGLSYVEIKRKTLSNKIGTYASVKESEFSADEILKYLREIAGTRANVEGLYLDVTLTFEVSGTASEFGNVARIWHDMARDNDYFENIYLEDVSRAARSGSKAGTVRFVFTGVVKEKQTTSES